MEQDGEYTERRYGDCPSLRDLDGERNAEKTRGKGRF